MYLFVCFCYSLGWDPNLNYWPNWVVKSTKKWYDSILDMDTVVCFITAVPGWSLTRAVTADCCRQTSRGPGQLEFFLCDIMRNHRCCVQRASAKYTGYFFTYLLFWVSLWMGCRFITSHSESAWLAQHCVAMWRTIIIKNKLISGFL